MKKLLEIVAIIIYSPFVLIGIIMASIGSAVFKGMDLFDKFLVYLTKSDYGGS